MQQLPRREVRPEQPVHASACCGPATRPGGSPVSAACCAACSCPAPTTSSWRSRARSPTIDQSKVWPAGTCLGIDPTTNQPTDIPVDCAAPHAMEVTGAVNLAEKFPGGLPPEPDQDAFIKDACTRMTDAYLAPIAAAQHHADADLQHDLAAELVGGQPPGVVQHRRHPRQRRLVDAAQQRQGPAADQRSAAGAAAGHPRGAAQPAADPDARGDRLVVVGSPQLGSRAAARRSRAASSSASGQQTQHMPAAGTTAAADAHRQAPATDGRRPQGNTFLNGPPPAAGRAATAGARPPPPPPGAPPLPRTRPGPRRPAAARTRCCRPPPGTVTAVAVRMSPQRFDELVSDALDLIPPKLAAAHRQRRRAGRADRNAEEPDLLGLYEGVALTERDSWYAGLAARHHHDLPRRAAGHLRHRGRGRRRGGDHGHPRDRPPLRHRRRPAARTRLGLAADSADPRGNHASSVIGAMNGP